MARRFSLIASRSRYIAGRNMSSDTNVNAASTPDQLLARKRALDLRALETAEFAARLWEVRTWQATRLARTYDDLRTDPRYARAIDFFLTDLAGPQDFTRRDRDLTFAWVRLQRTLPQPALNVLARAIEFEVLTAELDHALAAQLPPGPLTESTYAAGYRAVGNREARVRQIELVISMGWDLDWMVRMPGIGLILQLAHIPAHAAGFGALQDFLERGFAAFREVRSTERLLDAIRERETRLLDTLFARCNSCLTEGSTGG